MGNSLLRRAVLRIRKRKLKVKISRHFEPNLTTDKKLLEAGYCKLPLRSLIKFNKGQSALHTDRAIVR